MTTNVWTVESVAAEAAKYTTRTKFSKGSTEAYRFALSHNLLDTICGHMAVRGRRTKWTKELCAEEAKKYTSRSAFMNGTPSAYMAAYHCKWMDEFFPVNTNVWTVESVSAEAAKYTTRTEFFQGSGSAYRFARAHNLLDSICGHMITPCRQYKRSNEARAE